MITPRQFLPLAALLAAVSAGQLCAQSVPTDRNHLYDRLQFSGSLTGVRISPKIRVDASDSSPGSEVNSGELGLGKNGLEPRLSLRWRPGRRHEIEASYLVARSSGSRALADTVVFGDSTFAAGLRVNSTFKSDQAALTYRFAFHARERSQMGLAVGLGALFFKVGIDAVAGATSGGPDTTIIQFASSKAITAPTASLGLYGRWRAGSRWYIETDARALGFSVGRITAAVVEAGAAGRYFVSPRFGIEGGYGFTWVKVTLDPRPSGAGLAGQLRYSLQNLRLGIVAIP